MLVLYIVGGLTLLVTSLLPGNTGAWRYIGSVLGLVVAGWAAWALLFGGWIIINFYVMLFPFILAFKAISAAVKARKAARVPAPVAAAAAAEQPRA